MSVSEGSKPTLPHLMVCLGASAGGLRALETFFQRMPAESGCSFVVVQHLSPDFRSLMDDLLARRTTIRIQHAEENLPLAPDTIYLIPPKKLMTVAAGRLHLTERTGDRPVDLPINVFLESLARDAGARAVALILSGTGTDGTEGVRAVHAAGGLVIVQDPATAEFDGMPLSAEATGVADYVLPPEVMPEAVLAYQRDPARRIAPPAEAAGPAAAEPRGGAEFTQVFKLLKRGFGLDFSHYKFDTVERRIKRRATLSGFEDFAEYLQRLEEQPRELNSLYRDLLIGVTEFFRDPPAFAALREHVYRPLLREAGDQEIRVWVAACATGEEAYSHAILLHELARETDFSGRLAIFATDVHRHSIETASAGIYSPERLALLPPEQRARYFQPEKDGAWRIANEIRQSVVFAPHNLLQDPPFTKIDVISCRNLLIYLDPAAQERVISVLHYALKPRGALMLGLSEGVARLTDDFEVVDAKQKIYRKRRESRLPLDLRSPLTGRTTLPRLAPVVGAGIGQANLVPRGLLHAYDQLLDRHLPPGFIVNAEGDILHFIGDAARLLRPQTGRASDNLINRTAGDFRLAVSTLLPKAQQGGGSVVSRAVTVEPGSGPAECCDVEVTRLAEDRAGVALFHVSLRPVEVHRALPPGLPATGAAGGGTAPVSFSAVEALQQRIADLEQQLIATKENLQVTVEELQTTNEELQAANEEMLASNEELQSTNEELHSVNEELYTVNSEFERKNTELSQTIADLDNLLAATDAGTLFLDRELRIRRFNPAIQAIFKLLPTDIGRPLEHIAYQLANQAQMVDDTRQVLESGKPVEGEVRTRDGHWLLKRILPFRGVKQEIEGVVLTFTQLDVIKQMQAKLDIAMISSRLVWWEWDIGTDVLETHASGWCILGYELECLARTARTWFDLTHPDDLPRVRQTLDACLKGERAEWECEHRLKARDQTWRWVLNKGRAAERDLEGRPTRMLGTTQDIHAKKQAEIELMKLSLAIQHSHASIVITDAEGRIEYVNQAFTRVTGYDAQEVVGQNPRVLNSGHHPKAFFAEMWARLLRGEVWQGELLNKKRDGALFWERVSISPVRNDNGAIAHFVAVKEDVTQHKAEERKRELLEQQLAQSQKMETLGTLAGGIAHDFNNLLTGILGYSRTARMSLPADHPAIASLDVVDQTSRRAAELVRRILAFSRHHVPSHAPVVVSEVVGRLFPMLRSSVPTSIELTLHDTSGGATVMGDAAQLEQLIVNLCTNAAHAIGAGKGSIQIEVSLTELHRRQSFDVGTVDAGLFLKLSVADTGVGIDEKVRQRIFEPFFTTKAPGEGTGLGLSIVHSTVMAHHGAIELRSRPGHGSTFSVLLPIARSRIEAPPAGEPAAPAAVAPRPSVLADLAVFVIDDEEFIAQLTAKVLLTAGAKPTVFTSAQDCLATLRVNPRGAALIVTDQTMPGMTGVEFAEAIRALGIPTPVIIASGYTGAVDPRTLRNLEPCRFLAKPFEMEVLLVEAAALVGRR